MVFGLVRTRGEPPKSAKLPMSGKTDSPPPLPQEVFDRVVRVAWTDGRILLLIAGVFALFAASIREGPGTIAGVLAAGAGALELHGVNMLQRGDARAIRWLIASQVLLFATICGYVVARWLTFDPAVIERLLSPEIQAQFTAGGIQHAEIVPMIRQVYQIGYGVLILASLAYQGGMAWYFFRRRAAIRQALDGQA
jgi:hypothetical protein